MRRKIRVHRAAMQIVTVTIVLGLTGAIVMTQRPGTPTGAGQPLDPDTRDQNRRLRFTPSAGKQSLLAFLNSL